MSIKECRNYYTLSAPVLDVYLVSLPPANEVCEGYVFTGVCLSTGGGRAWLLPGGGGMCGCSGGACMVAPGGRAWFYSVGGCGFIQRGACVVLFSGGACVVLFGGGMRGFIQPEGCVHGFIQRGACMVLFSRGGMRGFIQQGGAWFYSAGGACVVLFSGGACVVLFSGGHAWFYSGGGVRGFFSFFGYNEIRSMSGRYASYWNAFLFWYVGNELSYWRLWY